MRKFFSQLFTKILDNLAYFWITLAITFIITRLTVWFYPINSDHWIFYYVGKIFAHGGTLYVSAWDHKPPMIFVFNGLMSLIFGSNLVLHRIFLTLLALLSIYLFYLLSKIIIPKLNLDNSDRLVKLSVLLFAFWANLSQFTSSGNNTENFGLIFLLLMFLAYFWFLKDKNRLYLLLAGVSLSILFFLKGTFLLLALPIGIEMLLSKRGVKNIILDILVFIAPLFVHAGIWLWYFASRGSIHDFIVASFSFSSKYVKSSWLGHVSSNKATFVGIMLPIFTVFLIFGVKFLKDFINIRGPIYSRRFGRDPESLASGRFLLFWTLASFAIGLFAGDFYPYYFLIFIPSFIFILIYWQDIYLKTLDLKRGIVVAILILSMIISLGFAYKQFYNYFAGSGKAEITEFNQIANYIDANSNPSDKIVFYSYGATMYHLANRDSGSRFVSASVLLLDEREHYGFNLSDIFIADMQKSQPKFVIMSTDPNDLYYENQKATDYLRANFTPVKTFDTFFVAENNNL